MPLPEGAGDTAIPVIVNRSGGTAARLGDALGNRIDAAFAAADLTADIYLVDGCDIAEAVRAAAGAPLVVVGGGDGTLGTAAQARVESGGAFGILPLGTRNHLALELGIPAALEGAVQVIAAGHSRRIDLASVNDRMFVNNASIGFYPLLVRWRDVRQGRRGYPKWLATIAGAASTLRRLPHHRLRITLSGRPEPIATPLLFVGNNRYELERGQIGRRLALDDGTLSVFAVATHSRAGIVWFALRTLAGRSDPERDFAALGECTGFTVASRSKRIAIALDGEVARMTPPLRFAVHPGALTVLAPPLETRAPVA